MSTAIGFVSQRGDDLELKGRQFEKIAALISSGFFPKGIDTVQKAVAIQWMGDAVGAHPMIALQEAYVVHGKVSFTWRFKLGLIQSRLPDFEWEQVSGDERQFTLRGRRSKDHAWVQVTYTVDEARKAGRFQNQLYQSDWSAMGFKQAMHRLLDRIASDVLKGLPVPEFVEGEEVDTPNAPSKSTAEVLDDALKIAGGASGAETTTDGGVRATPSPPAQPPSEPAPSTRGPSPQWKRDLYAAVRRVWPGGPERGAAAGAFVLEKASIVRKQLTGFTEPLTAETLTKDIGETIVRFLDSKYPAKPVVVEPPAIPIPPAPAGTAAPDPTTWTPPDGYGEAWEPPVPEEEASFEPEAAPAVTWETFMARVEHARSVLPPTVQGKKQQIVAAPTNDPTRLYLVSGPVYQALRHASPPVVWYSGECKVAPEELTKMDAALMKYVASQTGSR